MNGSQPLLEQNQPPGAYTQHLYSVFFTYNKPSLRENAIIVFGSDGEIDFGASTPLYEPVTLPPLWKQFYNLTIKCSFKLLMGLRIIYFVILAIYSLSVIPLLLTHYIPFVLIYCWVFFILFFGLYGTLKLGQCVFCAKWVSEWIDKYCI